MTEETGLTTDPVEGSISLQLTAGCPKEIKKESQFVLASWQNAKQGGTGTSYSTPLGDLILRHSLYNWQIYGTKTKHKHNEKQKLWFVPRNYGKEKKLPSEQVFGKRAEMIGTLAWTNASVATCPLAFYSKKQNKKIKPKVP